jgi:N-acetylmuramoyl-L-alanine amidase
MGRGKAPSGPLPLLPDDVKFIVVHCSATAPSADVGLVDIDRWHRLRGFLSCGYHYIVRRDGRIEEGRKLTERGAHVEGHNHESIGICLIGGVDATKRMRPEANFTSQQLATLKSHLAALSRIYPDAVVQGHRDFPNVAKACPSFDVKHWLNTGTIKP